MKEYLINLIEIFLKEELNLFQQKLVTVGAYVLIIVFCVLIFFWFKNLHRRIKSYLKFKIDYGYISRKKDDL